MSLDCAEATAAPNGALASVWRGVNFAMAVFFLLAALANLNDGDWYIWTPIYIIPFGLCLMVTIKPELTETHIWSYSSYIHCAICLGYAFYQGALLVGALAGEIKNPLQHEEGREMGGLFIMLTWHGIGKFFNFGRSGTPVSNRSLMSALLLMSVTMALFPLFLWSLCFISDWHLKIGHCNGMFT